MSSLHAHLLTRMCIQSSSAAGSALLSLLGVALGDITGQIGLQCSPLSVVGVGSEACGAHPVCCQNNNVVSPILLSFGRWLLMVCAGRSYLRWLHSRGALNGFRGGLVPPSRGGVWEGECRRAWIMFRDELIYA